jgi:hypothetical protein
MPVGDQRRPPLRVPRRSPRGQGAGSPRPSRVTSSSSARQACSSLNPTGVPLSSPGSGKGSSSPRSRPERSSSATRATSSAIAFRSAATRSERCAPAPRRCGGYCDGAPAGPAGVRSARGDFGGAPGRLRRGDGPSAHPQPGPSGRGLDGLLESGDEGTGLVELVLSASAVGVEVGEGGVGVEESVVSPVVPASMRAML